MRDPAAAPGWRPVHRDTSQQLPNYDRVVATRVGQSAAAVVLAGGRSLRMGTAKAALEWHGSTLLRRTLGVLARAVDGPLLVVRGPGQPLPDIPPHVEVVDDPEPGWGPLQGVAAGLAALDGLAPAAFICST